MSRFFKMLVAVLWISAFMASLIPVASNAQNCVPVSQASILKLSPHSGGGLDPTGTVRDLGYASKLNPGGQIVIKADEGNNLLTCRSLTSLRTDAPLYVPWNSPVEWSSFLSAAPHSNVNVKVGSCCPPMVYQLCQTIYDSNGNPIPASLGQVELGRNVLGTPLVTDPATGAVTTQYPLYGDYNINGVNTNFLMTYLPNPPNQIGKSTEFWGVEGDTWTFSAAQQYCTNTTDYQVTWKCAGGQWFKTSEIGSCTPINGACSISPGTLLASLPTDTQTLCGAGSILQNLQTVTNASGVTTGWTWSCNGTPGMTNQPCSATYSSTVNGLCGSDNGTMLPVLSPTDPNLCAQGTVAAFSGNGPWTWQCLGLGTGMTASCSTSNANSVDPSCGSADTGNSSYTLAQLNSFITANPSYLCSPGNFNTNYGIQGGGSSPYFWWYCSGTSNSQNVVSCSAYNSVIDGQCGRDNGAVFNSLTTGPSQNLCEGNGSVPSSVTYNPTTQTWTWTCAGVNGGATASCSSIYNPAAVIGVCGADSNASFCTLSATDPGLCTSGTPTPIIINGRWFGWTCSGSGGGSSTQCQALNTCAPGQCGNAAGNPSATVPTGGLCQSGTPSTPTNVNGTWTWTCQGGATTTPATCTAPVATVANTPTCGPATTAAASASAPVSGLCGVGNASTPALNSGSTLWQWSCSVSGGSSINCSAPATSSSGGPTGGTVVNGTCGSANGATSVNAPTSNLCSTGGASIPTTDAANANWVWSCSGSGGGTSSTCSAPMSTANGVCGLSNGASLPNPPNNCTGCNQCSSGISSVVAGGASGPWTWTCQGIGGGTNSPQCIAYLCNACSGTQTLSQSQVVTGTTTSRCVLTTQVTWSEVDTLSSTATANYTVTWTDAGGTHSLTMYPLPNSSYCKPCGVTVASITGFTVTVTAISGSCTGYTVGMVLPITTLGSKVTVVPGAASAP